jgi:hypothetical protein
MISTESGALRRHYANDALTPIDEFGMCPDWAPRLDGRANLPSMLLV